MLDTTYDPSSYLVIMPITDNLDELEAAWNRYNELPIELMQDSDDACIAKYGVNNQTLYQRLKAKLSYEEYELEDKDEVSLTPDSDSIMSEGFAFPVEDDDFILDDDNNNPNNKIDDDNDESFGDLICPKCNCQILIEIIQL